MGCGKKYIFGKFAQMKPWVHQPHPPTLLLNGQSAKHLANVVGTCLFKFCISQAKLGQKKVMNSVNEAKNWTIILGVKLCHVLALANHLTYESHSQ
jgi:hypothetical protein